MKKTDKEDSLKLAHILEDFPEERLPEVPVPSDKEMNRRKILASYRRAQQSRNREINRLHGLFLAQGITTMSKQDLSTEELRKERISVLTGIEKEEAEYLVLCLDLHEQQIKVLQRQIKEESSGDEVIQRLQSIPGVGPMVAFAFVSHVGAERFENSGQVSNYLGLVPRVYMSGDMVRYGRITKRGNGYLRALLVQGAWAVTRTKKGGKLKERFEYMTIDKSTSKKKAIVAIARRMAELMYTLMRDGTMYEERTINQEKKAKELALLAMSA
jgi:transposase